MALGVYISPEITSFAGLFETLMEIGRNLAYNLVIDEFQEFFYINPAVYSQIQDIWDRYKDSTRRLQPQNRNPQVQSSLRLRN